MSAHNIQEHVIHGNGKGSINVMEMNREKDDVKFNKNMKVQAKNLQPQQQQQEDASEDDQFFKERDDKPVLPGENKLRRALNDQVVENVGKNRNRNKNQHPQQQQQQGEPDQIHDEKQLPENKDLKKQVPEDRDSKKQVPENKDNKNKQRDESKDSFDEVKLRDSDSKDKPEQQGDKDKEKEGEDADKPDDSHDQTQMGAVQGWGTIFTDLWDRIKTDTGNVGQLLSDTTTRVTDFFQTRKDSDEHLGDDVKEKASEHLKHTRRRISELKESSTDKPHEYWNDIEGKMSDMEDKTLNHVDNWIKTRQEKKEAGKKEQDKKDEGRKDQNVDQSVEKKDENISK